MHSDNKIERPNENNKAQKNDGDDLSRPRPQWLPRWLFNALGPIALLVLVFGGVAAYYAYHYVTKDSVRFQFWVGFMFSFMAFVVLLVQSVIYAQQAEFMKEQSRAMQRSVELTDAIIENMDKQLTSLVHQETTMQGQLEEMRRQIKISDIQFEAQLEFTRIGITTAEKSAIYAQRAYVTAKIRGTGEGSHQWRLRIENSGGTPANNVSVSYSYEFRETPPWDSTKPPFSGLPEEQIVFDSYFTKVERLGVIAPNSSYHIIRTPKVDALTPEQHKQWRAEELRFFCWGSITYEDIFNEKRRTEFCFFESQRHPNGYPCEHGNEAY